MADYLSPRIRAEEIDATLRVPEMGDQKAGLVGTSVWGPANIATYMTGGEDEMVRRFGKPNDSTFKSFFVGCDYTSYVSKLSFVRAIGPNARNAVSNQMLPILVPNDDVREHANLVGYGFMGKYPGSVANNVTVSVVDKDSFATWEYAKSFQYEPLEGEFNVAVLDGSGYWTGYPARKQTERISFSGTAVAGTQQAQTVSFTGTATGGTKQEETLTVGGLITSGADFVIVVDGNNVTLSETDTPETAAAKIADALAQNVAKYDSATASGNRVFVVFKVPAVQTVISSVSMRGITVSSFVTKIGTPKFIMSVYGKQFQLVYGDTAVRAANAYYDVMRRDEINYHGVTLTSPNAVTYTFNKNGLQPTDASVVNSGYTVATNVLVQGTNTAQMVVMGVPVDIVDGDKAVTIATKVSVQLNQEAHLTAIYESISADRSSVLLRQNEYGLKPITGGTSGYQLEVYVDYDLQTPGSLGQLIEKYEVVRQEKSAKFSDGSTAYFFDKINNGSNLIAVADAGHQLTVGEFILSGGADDYNVDLIGALDHLKGIDALDLQYLIDASSSPAVQKKMLDIVEKSRLAVGFISPPIGAVLGNNGNQVADIKTWKTIDVNRDTSYGIADDNWGYMFDKYNDTYRWIPISGGTAGLYARTARDQDSWVSPAGHNRGRYKNYDKLAWNSSEPDRDELFKSGINSAVTFTNEGMILYGDKTMTTRPSAFDQATTRFAFIALARGVKEIAKQFLFEANNEFTRAQFLNATRPFCRNMVSRNAFEDVRIVCDESNNGPEVRAQNRAVIHIFAKPMYVVRYIDIYMVAVRPDVTFEEIEGQLIR